VGQAALDPRQVLERLRADHQALRWGPLPPEEPRGTGGDRAPLDRSSLDYLHQNWALADASAPTAPDSGFRGWASTLFGRLTYRVLGPYLRREQEFLAQAVQVIDDLDRRCNELAQRCQELSDAVIDRQVAEAENQAKLALWLHLDPPATATPAAPTPAAGDTGPGECEPGDASSAS
jgi:hypothetical protein